MYTVLLKILQQTERQMRLENNRNKNNRKRILVSSDAYNFKTEKLDTSFCSILLSNTLM